MRKTIRLIGLIAVLLITAVSQMALAGNGGDEIRFGKQPFIEGQAESTTDFTYGEPIYGLVTLSEYDDRNYEPIGREGSLWDIFEVQDERTVFEIRLVFYCLKNNFQSECRVNLKATNPLTRLRQLPLEIAPDYGKPVQLGTRFYADLYRDALTTSHEKIFAGASMSKMGVSLYASSSLTTSEGTSLRSERLLGKGVFKLTDHPDGLSIYQTWEKKFRADADKKRFMPRPGCKNPALEKQLLTYLQKWGITDNQNRKAKILRVVILDNGWHIAWIPEVNKWCKVTLTAAAIKYPNGDVVVEQFIFYRMKINGPIDGVMNSSDYYEYYLWNYTMDEENVNKNAYESPDYRLNKNS